MGREVEQVLISREHKVILRVDETGEADTRTLDIPKDADGVIEFALAGGIPDRIKIYRDCGKPVVIGTTGWDKSEGRKIFSGAKSALMEGSNFSVGAHLFFRLSAQAARLINRLDEYDAALTEYHHNKKADYPSGTALTAAQGVLEQLDRKHYIMKDLPDGPVPPQALQVASVRVGSVPGIHEMRMDSAADFLTLRHEARSRGGFALGAVRALEWLKGRSGWFSAEDFINDLLEGENV